MAPLTWRNVAPQGFGDSVAALGLGARSMERGFAGLTEALGDWDKWRTEQNDRNVLAAAQRIQDPTSYREALQNGSILGSIDPSQVSARTLQAVDNRSRTLLDQAVTGYTFDRTRTNDAAMDAAGPALAALAAARSRGNPAEIAAVEAQHRDVLARLPADQILRTATGLQGLESSAVNMAGARQTQAQSGERHGWARTDRTDLEAGRSAANEALESSADRDGQIAYIQSRTDLSPAAKARAIALIAGESGSFYPTLDAPTAPARGTGTPGRAAGGTGQSGAGSAALARPAGGVDPGSLAAYFPAETQQYTTRIMERVAAANGGQIPSGSIDQVTEALLPFLVQQESGGRHTNADGSLITNPRSGAAGVTQVMRRTGEDPGYGVRPLQNQSREEYLRFGRDYLRAMLQKYDGNVELALAAYNHGPGNVDNARARHASAQGIQGEVAAGQELARGIALRRSQERAGTILGRYWDSISDDAPAAEVANRLTRAGSGSGDRAVSSGALVGMNATEVQDEINRLMLRGRAAGINAATAGAIILNNASSRRTGWGISGARERAIDSSANDTELARVMDTTGPNGMRGALDSDRQTSAIEASVTNAVERVQTLTAETLRLRRMAQSNPRLARDLERRENDLREARRRLAAIQARHSSRAVRESLMPLTGSPVGANPRVAEPIPQGDPSSPRNLDRALQAYLFERLSE